MLSLMRRTRWLGSALFALVACSPAPAGLTVELRTDILPATEFASVQTEVSSAPFASAAPTGSVRNAPADASADYVHGARVAELTEVGPGDWFVRVSLLDAMNRPLIRRTTVLSVRGRHALTVVISRTCARVVCPETGDDPTATECSGGRCVVPRCSPETPELCPTPACRTDVECATGACGAGTCASGACLVSRDDGACGAGACQPDFTCSGARAAGASDAAPADAGTDGGPRDAGTDVGPRDAGSCMATESACTNAADDDCDGLEDCADPDCGGASCDDGEPCTHHDQCSTGACRGTNISCVSTPCRTITCNGTATCTTTNVPDLTGCPDEGNPCTDDWCGGGTCVHWPRADNAQYDGDYYHRCCGGTPTQTGTDSNCDSCGNDCSGQGCFTFLGIASCYCPVSNQFCSDRGRGTCFDGYGADGIGWMCQCQGDFDCAPGQTCCMNGPPAFRHFCFFGSCG